MQSSRRSFGAFALSALALTVAGTCAVPALAQEWPTRPVRLINPFAAGSAVDVVARLLADRMSKDVGTQFLVENRTGASGNIGTEVAARSKPDGYTFLVGSPGTMAINPEDLLVNDSIMPANADLNNLGAMEVKDGNYLFQGLGEYEQGGFRGNKGVIVKGIWAPPNTRVLRLNIARGSSSSIDLWNDRSKVRETAGEEAKLMLVDDLGRTYFPIGYIHATATGDRRVNIALQRDGGYYEIGKFPNLSSSGSDKLYAIFTPAIGRTIVGIKLGDQWVATANLPVPNPS